MEYTRPVPYEEIDHTADAGLRVQGASPEETLARLVLAYAEMVSGEVSLPLQATLTVRVEPSDRAAMAVDVLRELLFELDCRNVVPISCAVDHFEEVTGCVVHVGVGRLDPEQGREGLVLKAVTFHGARFEQEDGHWVAEVVFDV